MSAERDTDVLGAAEAVLRANDEGGYTVPSRLTYPHQWNWDSALCALGWAVLDPARAWTELETLVAARDANGMVPSIAFRPDGPALGSRSRLRGLTTALARPGRRYSPGPRWWGRRLGSDGRRVTGITQPPLAATALRLVFERHPDERRARALLRPLHEWHRFLLTERDPDGLGEPVVIHPWETGRDNAVEWDVPLWRVMPEVSVVHRRDTEHVKAAERPTDEHYRRFLTLVRRGTAAGWPQRELARSGPFRVLDPGFSAILARACLDLSDVALALGEPQLAQESGELSERVAGALAARAGSDGLVRPVDLDTAQAESVDGAGSALALLAPGLPERSVAAARALMLDGELTSPFGVRTLSASHPLLQPANYWRGPVWANVTWLCAHALALRGDDREATRLRGDMLRAIAGAGMREYFRPDTGAGLGTHDFAWTAALALHAGSSDG